MSTQDDGYCETANKLHDLKVFCWRKSNDLNVTKVKVYGGSGDDANER